MFHFYGDEVKKRHSTHDKAFQYKATGDQYYADYDGRELTEKPNNAAESFTFCNLHNYPRQEALILHNQRQYQTEQFISQFSNQNKENFQNLDKYLEQNPSYEFLMAEYNKLKNDEKETKEYTQYIPKVQEEEVDDYIKRLQCNLRQNPELQPDIQYSHEGEYIPRAQREKTINVDRQQYRLAKEEFARYKQKQLEEDANKKVQLIHEKLNLQPTVNEVAVLREKVKQLEQKLQNRPTDDLVQQLVQQCVNSNQVLCQLVANKVEIQTLPQSQIQQQSILQPQLNIQQQLQLNPLKQSPLQQQTTYQQMYTQIQSQESNTENANIQNLVTNYLKPTKIPQINEQPNQQINKEVISQNKNEDNSNSKKDSSNQSQIQPEVISDEQSVQTVMKCQQENSSSQQQQFNYKNVISTQHIVQPQALNSDQSTNKISKSSDPPCLADMELKSSIDVLYAEQQKLKLNKEEQEQSKNQINIYNDYDQQNPEPKRKQSLSSSIYEINDQKYTDLLNNQQQQCLGHSMSHSSLDNDEQYKKIKQEQEKIQLEKIQLEQQLKEIENQKVVIKNIEIENIEDEQKLHDEFDVSSSSNNLSPERRRSSCKKTTEEFRQQQQQIRNALYHSEISFKVTDDNIIESQVDIPVKSGQYENKVDDNQNKTHSKTAGLSQLELSINTQLNQESKTFASSGNQMIDSLQSSQIKQEKKRIKVKKPVNVFTNNVEESSNQSIDIDEDGVYENEIYQTNTQKTVESNNAKPQKPKEITENKMSSSSDLEIQPKKKQTNKKNNKLIQWDNDDEDDF